MFDNEMIDGVSIYRKRKRRNRINNTKKHKKNRFKMCEMMRGSYTYPYYIRSEKMVCSYEYTFVPAYDEKERCLVCYKNAIFNYTDDKGISHYSDFYRYEETGRIIHHRAKYKKHRINREYVPCEPYVLYAGRSNSKQFFKRYSHKTDRQLYRIALNHTDIDNSTIACDDKHSKYNFYNWT